MENSGQRVQCLVPTNRRWPRDCHRASPLEHVTGKLSWYRCSHLGASAKEREWVAPAHNLSCPASPAVAEHPSSRAARTHPQVQPSPIGMKPRRQGFHLAGKQSIDFDAHQPCLADSHLIPVLLAVLLEDVDPAVSPRTSLHNKPIYVIDYTL